MCFIHAEVFQKMSRGGLEVSFSIYKAKIKVLEKAMNRYWSNQKANPALKAKTGNKKNINTMRTNC